MITIDCRDVESIKNELLVYVSDQVAAIPTLKNHEFILSAIEDDETIDKTVVITSIKEFLESIGENHNFAVISTNDIVSIRSISGKTIERDQQPQPDMFSCTHCGFVTRFEVEHQAHMKIHYL
ncbi:MAG: C2H2-type zinc finger protein [Nitrosopumilaceae archaeon]|uniref:C2H2-type zinc finger protein n=1 Tax=Candidatus Nitrosomaritimum aestuariumsis TaxID=3342354 RepID=A0AC60W4G7_9ARCH|nr:C2H2-type zinc finger protein [Nitrosopumilaceae archaeon]